MFGIPASPELGMLKYSLRYLQLLIENY
jgi:hypothetical protein